MAWASRAGKATVDVENLDAFGQCDRCGCWRNLSELPFQYDYRGPRLMNIQIRVCRDGCLDRPCVWYKPIVVPADPIPVPNPRPAQTDTGDSGWSMGAGWSVSGWSQGSNYVTPAPITNAAPSMTTVSVDEE